MPGHMGSSGVAAMEDLIAAGLAQGQRAREKSLLSLAWRGCLCRSVPAGCPLEQKNSQAQYHRRENRTQNG